MKACETLTATASAGVAPALRAVDCLAGEVTASAFGRLFGEGGALLPALTILLTLYVAFFALALLTGRSRIGVAALTPRMLTLGLVLTFATSWVAYQGVVWTLAVGAPDQIAGVLMGTKGSATQIFADRIDLVFAAIAEVAGGGAGAQGTAGAAASGSFTPTNLIWLAALLLMLGTVGVLVTARIALAVLLALGPIFVVFALFSGTRGLTAGWLRGVVLTALAPLFAVLGGGFMLELAVPVIAGLRDVEGVDGRAAMALFVIAAVHVALMVMVLRVLATMVASWQVFGLATTEARGDPAGGTAAAAGSPAVAATAPSHATPAASPRRTAGLVAAPVYAAETTPSSAPAPDQARSGRTLVTSVLSGAEPLPALPRQRARGIGSRFRPAANLPREMFR
jgi:type IV secretion system protein VirB6